MCFVPLLLPVYILYLTSLSSCHDWCQGRTVGEGSREVPGSRQHHVTMLSSQCCLYWLLTTDYRLHIRLNLERQHRTPTHPTPPEFIKYLLDTLPLYHQAGEGESSPVTSVGICEKKNVWLLTNWYVIPGLYQEFTQYIILPSPISGEKGFLGVL